jgi:hypothetical protein
MHIIETTTLLPQQKTAVLRLWNNEYSEKLNKDAEGFENYLQDLGDQRHFLLVGENDEIAGWAFVFTRHSERWFAIVLDTKAQRKGYGRMLLDKLKETEPTLNGWVADHNCDIKADGSTYLSPLDFYLKSNFTILPECRLETDILSAVKIVWRKASTG